MGFVRFRDSKLTYFLKDSLGGHAYTLLIACITTDSKRFDDSKRTLDFARKARNIKAEVMKNEVILNMN